MYKKSITGIAIAALMAASLPAFAGGNSNNSDTIAQGGTGNGYGGNGYGGAGGSASAGAVGVGIAAGGAGGNGGSGGAGGAGGQGGAGGSVVGSGNSSATGGAVVGSGNSTQGQQQGQAQSSKNSNRNDNRSSASASNSGNNAAQQVNVGGDTVTYQAPKIPVATAYAAGLTASNGTCMGSTSAGVQGMSVGVSIGSTWKDAGCDRRYNAQALAAVGQAKAAVALLCQDTDIARAMDVAGTPCAKAEVKVSDTVIDADTTVAQVQHTDPIVRSRLGLPPLK